MRGSGIAAALIAAVLLAACTASPLPGTLPPAAGVNAVTAMSTRLTFEPGGAEGALQTASGIPLETVLLQLRRDPPALVTLQSFGGAGPRPPKIQAALEKAALADLALIEWLPSVPAAAERLELEVTYYRYSLADCGADLAYRKLDYIARTSPGFGCAVEQNRLLSLAYPAEWYEGRRLGPAASARDAAAVSRYFTAAPRPMPDAGR